MDWTQVMVAAISAAGLIAVALIGVWAAKESRATNKQLEGNGRGTMLEMLTDIHKEIGAAQEWRRGHEALHERELDRPAPVEIAPVVVEEA